jgi:two-component SAPR family response regulator
MARLSLTLLGGFQARVDDGRALGLSIKKARALLAYLANPAGKAHQRDKLAALLWGDMREPQARARCARSCWHSGEPWVTEARSGSMAIPSRSSQNSS